MIVPQFWAEGRIRDRVRDHQVTVRRFGWSDISQADAQQHADTRAREALDRLIAGDTVGKREPKVAYNGADGVPIREEILDRHGDVIITRNVYGARCLNTPNVLFADIDFAQPFACRLMVVLCFLLVLATVSSAIVLRSARIFILGMLFTAPAAALLTIVWNRIYVLINGGLERMARRRIDAFTARHPDWHLRLYRTPAGFRLLAMHQTFQPRDPEAAAFFDAVRADPVYVQMCVVQNCFRARVSPKPWRIGLETSISPRRGVWPINPDRLADRAAWVADYEQAARRFASCRFVTELGSSTVDPTAQSVMAIHDELCQANDTSLPIA